MPEGRHQGDRHRLGRRSQDEPRAPASPTWAPTTWWAGRSWARPPPASGPQGGKYATFVGLKGAANAIERIDGFAEGAGDKFAQVENLGDDMDLSVAQKNVKDALDRHPDLDVLVGIWAYNAHAIVEVVKQRGIRDKTTIVVFDAAPKAIGHMSDGNIDAMVVQNPYDMGYRGTRLMKALVAGRPRHDPRDAAGLRSRDTRRSPSPTAICWSRACAWCIPTRARRSRRRCSRRRPSFFRLSDFKKWLAEHNLTGS